MAKMRLALIAGGKSSEREVSLKSGAQVYEALDQEQVRHPALRSPRRSGQDWCRTPRNSRWP